MICGTCETTDSIEVNAKSSMLPRPSREQSVLNTIGVIVLGLGLAAGSVVLVRGTPTSQAVSNSPGEWQDNTLSIQDSKASSRDVEMYDGKLGLLVVKLSDAFHQPESLAAIIVGGSTLLALGCFYVSRRLPPDPPIGTDDFSS